MKQYQYYNRKYKYAIFEPNELKGLICDERNFHIVFCILPLFSHKNCYRCRHIFVRRTQLVKSASPALKFVPIIFLSCMHIVSQNPQHFFWESSAVIWL